MLHAACKGWLSFGRPATLGRSRSRSSAARRRRRECRAAAAIPAKQKKSHRHTCVAGQAIQKDQPDQCMGSACAPAETTPFGTGLCRAVGSGPPSSRMARKYDDMMTGLQRCDAPWMFPTSLPRGWATSRRQGGWCSVLRRTRRPAVR